MLGWAIACCAVAQPAFAQVALGLDWRAPEGCPSRDWVIARVSRQLGKALTPRDDAQLAVEVVIEAQPSGEREAQLTLVSSAGRRARSLHDRDCVLVADAVAFIIARAIDPSLRQDAAPLTAEERAAGSSGAPAAEGRASGTTTASAAPVAPEAEAGSESGSEPDPEPDPDPDPDPESDADSRPESPPGPPLHIGFALGAEAALAIQPLPDLAPGALLLGALLLGDHVRLELALGYFPARERALRSDPSVAARFDLLQAGLLGCAVARSSGSELGACLGAHAGAVRGQGDALSAGRDRALPYVALTLGPLLMQRVSERIVLRFGLAPSLALGRPRFVLVTEEVVYAVELFGFLASLGVELRFD